ncbi:hypothetical protein [Actinomadura rupiterrae]|uniref:hypothetical protein n=1 Tax=Actinomadura rupiterrae TaxID=559627 RepID=UPI0020A2A654|nr:hypothetical protein [Actinomadura rupiterrae]MCP2341047.1 hypothetical protein [Actinomadura rupiterrae]
MRLHPSAPLLALALAACSAGTPHRSPTPADLALLDRAENALIAGCMHARGFVYWPPPPPAESPPKDFPYVIDDVAWARAHGYGMADQLRIMRAHAANPNTRYVAALPPDRRRAYTLAMDGSGRADRVLSVRLPSGVTLHRTTDGCTARAKTRLYRDLNGWFRAEAIIDNISAEVQPKVRHDPRYTAARSAWSRCMAALHHPYAGPEEIRARLGHLSSDPSTEEERETTLAVAEATCAKSTGFGAAATALDREYRTAATDNEKSSFQTRQRLRAAALPRAQALLNDHT